MKDLSDQDHFGSTLRLKQVSAQKGKNLSLEDQFRRNSIINKRDLIWFKKKDTQRLQITNTENKVQQWENIQNKLRLSQIGLLLIYDGCSAFLEQCTLEFFFYYY